MLTGFRQTNLTRKLAIKKKFRQAVYPKIIFWHVLNQHNLHISMAYKTMNGLCQYSVTVVSSRLPHSARHTYNCKIFLVVKKQFLLAVALYMKQGCKNIYIVYITTESIFHQFYSLMHY